MRTIDDFTRPKEYITPLDEPLGTIVREWADKEVIPYRRQFDEDWEEHRLIYPPIKKLFGEYGIQRMLFPEDLGGMGMGASDYFLMSAYRLVEEIARADSGIAIAVGAGLI